MQTRNIDPEHLIAASERFYGIMEASHPFRTQAARDFMEASQNVAIIHSFVLNLYHFAEKHTDEWKAWSINAVQSNAYTQEDDAVGLWSVLHKEARTEAMMPHIYEMMFCRLVDAFQVYITDTIAYVYRKKPAILRSKETLPYDFILDHADMDELINAMIDRKVNQLAYSSVKDLDKYCQERGIELFADDDEREKAMYLIETRNIIVHNKGVVNQTYKSRLPNRPETIGSRIIIDFVGFYESLMEVSIIVATSAQRISIKFDAAKSASDNSIAQSL